MLKKTEAIKNKSNKEIKITAQRNVYAQLLMLVQENDIDLEKLFTFPLGPVPWPLATGDGMLTKTEKAVIPQAGSKCDWTDCSDFERRCACFRGKCFASFFTDNARYFWRIGKKPFLMPS